MYEYHKIETIYGRDESGTRKLLPGIWRDPTVCYLSELDWEWTEKIDGTNVRVIWDGYKVEFRGRTDKADLPKHLLDRLTEIFGGDEVEELFEQTFGEKTAVLYGEGYGQKIQKDGEKYIPGGCDFILFDVSVNNVWLNREDVGEISDTFGVESVPVVGIGPIRDAIAFVKQHPQSMIWGANEHEMEGLVCRPILELKDKRGNRVIVKIKYKDFKEEEK